MRNVLLFIGYLWAFPVTLFGYLLAAVGGVDFWGTKDFVTTFVVRPGLLMRAMDRYGIGGLTIGCVVFYREDWYVIYPEIVNHELTHVRQAMFVGPLYPLVYGVAALFGYDVNPFERQARRAEKEGVLNIWE